MKYKYKLEYRDKQLRAMSKLLEHYKKTSKGASIFFSCPICDIAKGCDWCVWKVEKGKTCIDYLEENKHSIHLEGEGVSGCLVTCIVDAKRCNVGWAKRRIRHLTKWIAKYEELK